jgi:hypothetical protein
MQKAKLLIACSIVVCSLVAGVVLFGTLNKKTDPNKTKPHTTTKPADTTPPAAQINEQNLSADSQLTGIVTIAIDTHDNVSVNKVEYYIDGNFFAVTYASPFSLQLDTSRLSAGKHTLSATAYDAAGNSTKSQAVTISVAASEQVPTDTSFTPSKKARHVTTASSSSQGQTTSPDTQAPSTSANLTLSSPNAYAVNLTWDASTDNVGVQGYRIYRDGSLLSTATGVAYTDYTVVPGNSYTYTVVAYDAASNTSSSLSPSITLKTTSIWDDFDQPITSGNDGVPLELGVKFKPKVNGKISGIRFYKASGDIGTHTGTLWSAGGSPITNVTFTNETASGWQQAVFTTPVDVTANTTYVVSYTTPTGKYSYSSDYFNHAGITNEYLMAPQSGGADGTNGVFSTTGGAFPTGSFSETNYWVDVLFIPNPAAGGPTPTLADSSQVFSGFPSSDNTGVVGMRLPRRDRVDALSGMTISGIDIENTITGVTMPNVTFDHVKFTYTGAVDATFAMMNIQVGTSGTQFLNCDFDGNDSVERAIYGTTDVIVRRSNIHNTANGIEVSDHITATDNYIHDIFTPVGQIWHADGIQTANTASSLTVTHNTIFLTGAETGAVNLVGRPPGSGDTLTDVLVDNNLMAGGSYTVYVGADVNTNVRILNNKYSTRYSSKVGAFNIYYPVFLSGITISGNTIYETGAPADVNLP